ncbi:MAG: phosphatase PAP2 family protein [Bacteroidota bacterium]
MSSRFKCPSVLLIFLFVLFQHENSYAQQNIDTTSSDSVTTPHSRLRKLSTWVVPGALILIGTSITLDEDADGFFLDNFEVREERNENFVNFSNKTDDYLQHVPSAAVFILDAFGVKPKTKIPDQIAIFVKSELLMSGLVLSLKKIVGEGRPDSGRKNSFPSGHTAQAFMAASFLSHEFGYRSNWYTIGAYTLATTVGTMRVLNNRHWISDIIAGAGFGILSTNVVYATHQYKWSKKSKSSAMLLPQFGGDITGLVLHISF